MTVDTKTYGCIDVDEKQKIVFPEGLLGFENLTDFILLDAEHEPFFYLQSISDRDIAFILIDPFVLRPDYEAEIDNEELTAIGLSEPKDALVFAIVTIPRDGGTITANLQGPLVINKGSSVGKQAILTDPRWKIKHDIMAELSSARLPC